MPAQMTSRERLHAALLGRTPDRVPRVDTSFWPGTIARWREEGLPEGVSPAQHFDLDVITLMPFDGTLRLPEEILEEDERRRVRRDANGVTLREFKAESGEYSPPVRLDSTMKGWDEWRELKPRLDVDPARIPANSEDRYAAARAQDSFVVARPIEPMWFFIEHLTGFERGLPLLCEQPDLAADVLQTYNEFMLAMFDLMIERGIQFDALWFFADLCYKGGMLFSPRIYRQLLLPIHRRVRRWCDERDMRLMMHCDGDVREFIPLLIEAGFDCIQPLEARCGNDVRLLKPEHGNAITFFGNIAVDLLSTNDREAIAEEVVSKVTAAKDGGRYIYHSDHSIPPTISFDSYAYVMELVAEHGSFE